MKKIMILGGRPAQTRCIQDAKDHGYFVVSCAPKAHWQHVQNADRIYDLDVRDLDALVDIAKKEKIDGIVSTKDDLMDAVSYVVEKLGLIGNSRESVLMVQDKARFRALQRKVGTFCPDFVVLRSVDEIETKVKNFRTPFIVKPTMSAGSCGIKKFDEYDEDAVRAAYQDCAEFSRNGEVIVETYIPRGLTNLECDVFVHRDRFLYVGYETNHCAPEKPMQPRGGMFPPLVSEEEKQKFEAAVEKLIHGAGLVHGMFNIEALFTESGECFILEVNARMAGALIPEAVKFHHDIDMYDLYISTAMGDDTYFEKVCEGDWPSRYLTLFEVFPYESGTFERIGIDETVMPRVRRIERFADAGKHVEMTKNSGDSLGMVFLEYEDRNTQVAELLELDRHIRPVIRKPQLSFRKAQATEADIALTHRMIHELSVSEGDAEYFVLTEEKLGEWMKRGDVSVLFAVLDGTEIGYALYYHDFASYLGRTGVHLEDLFVMKEFRGRGYGRRLLQEVAKQAVSEGSTKLEWVCHNDHAASQAFYAAMGAQKMDKYDTLRLFGEGLKEFAEKS